MSGSLDETVRVDVVVRTDVSELDQERLRSIVRFVLGAEKQRGGWAVTVVLVADDELRALHQRFMGIDEETDVMTFPLGEELRGGDIVVSVHRASEQAASYGHTAPRELEFLVVHGVLHLTGWDDGDAAMRSAMLARQGELLLTFDSSSEAAVANVLSADP